MVTLYPQIQNPETYCITQGFTFGVKGSVLGVGGLRKAWGRKANLICRSGRNRNSSLKAMTTQFSI